MYFDILELNSVSEFKDIVINQELKVIGVLLDSYVVGYWVKVVEDFVLKNLDFCVGIVFDYQFVYGFVIVGVLKDVEKCMRKKFNSMEIEIMGII